MVDVNNNAIGVWALEDGKQLLLIKTDEGVQFIIEELSKKRSTRLTIESFRLNKIIEFIKE